MQLYKVQNSVLKIHGLEIAQFICDASCHSENKKSSLKSKMNQFYQTKENEQKNPHMNKSGWKQTKNG